MKRRDDAKKDAAKEVEARKRVREGREQEKFHEWLEAIGSMKPASRDEVQALTLPKLCGLLLRDDGSNWKEKYSKLKKKPELVEAVIAFYNL